ncbi:MAG: hypothetical protein J5733_05155 [Bacteroidaceae bacterium]|nr:hypothetical protein [Bacteroidaceae bacterium]
MKKNIFKHEPFRPNFPNLNKLEEDEYIISWRITNMDHIHHIQKYFGMPRYTTVNYRSKIKIKRDDPKFKDFLDGIRKGFYWAYNKMSANVKA